jgi:hypothetical protein
LIGCKEDGAWTLHGTIKRLAFPCCGAETRSCKADRHYDKSGESRAVLTKDGDADLIYFKGGAHRSWPVGIETTLLHGRRPAILLALQLTECAPAR